MAISKDQILDVLRSVRLPGTGASVLDAQAVRQVEVEGSEVSVVLETPPLPPSAADGLRAEVAGRLEELPEVDRARIEVRAMLPMAGPSTRPGPSVPAGPAWSDRIPGVRNLLAVASGKGGVGKSTVAANLALALAGLGRRVGLLDADIYGPSQQLMTGAKGEPEALDGNRIVPLEAEGGIKVMSFGFLIDPDQPVIWRGPMLMKALEQFVGDVEWGELDDLVIDLPPGTGDVALTLCQNLPVAGAIIVTTPQDVALIDARKALFMFRKLSVPVLGIVENMSHFECPACGHREHVFGRGGGVRTAEQLGVALLGQIPLDPAIVVGGDEGRPVVTHRPESAAARALSAITAVVAEALERDPGR